MALAWHPCMPRAHDLTGIRYNLLTAVRFTGRYYRPQCNNPKRIWLFRCDCGVEKEYRSEDVVSGDVRSCGCSGRCKYFGLDAVAYGVYSKQYADGDVTFEQFYQLSQQPCWYCGDGPSNHLKGRSDKKLVFHYNGLDRLDSTQTHNLSNVVTACWPCNIMKRASTLEAFLSRIQKISRIHHQ